MAYDSTRNRVVLYGGSNLAVDTWLWDGVTWTQASPGSSPSARAGHAMAYDEARQVVVLFGGAYFFSNLGDTWEWDGTQWAQVTTNPSPAARYDHAMVYDSRRQRIVLFGGIGTTGPLSDTWEWDGRRWAQLFPAQSPSARFDHAMAYDSLRDRIVLFGGWLRQGDTWELTGTTWTKLSPATSPLGRQDSAMAFDTIRSVCVLYGGDRVTSGYGNDTWEWNGTTWIQPSLTVNPGPEYVHAMAYDSARGQCVLFGGYYGLNETWEYGTPTPIDFPAAATTSEGNTSTNIPFATQQSRIQCLMEAQGLSRTEVATVNALQLRRDRGTSPYTARQIDLTVLFGVPSTTAETMSTTFSANWRGLPTLVFLGRYSVPSQGPEPIGPAPFSLNLPFGAPFAWNGTDDLMWEIQAANNTATSIYDVDAFLVTPPRGTVLAFGTSCASPTNVTPVYPPPDETEILPGGRIVNDIASATPGVLGLHFLGDDTTHWGPLPLPFVWPGTNCTIWTSLVASQFLPVNPGGAARVIWAIPNQPSLQGATVNGQWAVFEGPTANPPITLTHAYAITVGLNPPILFQTITNTNGGSTGVKPAQGYLGVATRLVLQ